MRSVKCAVLCEIVRENIVKESVELTHLKKKEEKHFVDFLLRYFCNATLQA